MIYVYKKYFLDKEIISRFSLRLKSYSRDCLLSGVFKTLTRNIKDFTTSCLLPVSQNKVRLVLVAEIMGIFSTNLLLGSPQPSIAKKANEV